MQFNTGSETMKFFRYLQKKFTLRETVENLLYLNNHTLNAVWGRRPAVERKFQKAVRLCPLVPGWEPVVSLDDGSVRF